MEMTKEEIRRSYRQAKDKNVQVEILAQLNACDTHTIKQIIEASEEKTLPVIKKEVKEESIIAAFKSGKTTSEVANLFDISYSTAYRIKDKAGLLVKRPHKKAEVKSKEIQPKKVEVKSVAKKTDIKTKTKTKVDAGTETSVQPRKVSEIKTLQEVFKKPKISTTKKIPTEIQDIINTYDVHIKELETTLNSLKKSRKYLLDVYTSKGK